MLVFDINFFIVVDPTTRGYLEEHSQAAKPPAGAAPTIRADIALLREAVVQASFHAHLETFAGADVVGRYSAASMTSLLAGGTPSKAIDVVYKALSPRDTAQMILDSLPTYPL